MSDLDKPLTKTACTKLARAKLAHGHFVHVDGAWVDCPHPLHVHGIRAHRVTLYATAGRLPHGEMVRQLARAVLDCDTDWRAERDARDQEGEVQ